MGKKFSKKKSTKEDDAAKRQAYASGNDNNSDTTVDDIDTQSTGDKRTKLLQTQHVDSINCIKINTKQNNTDINSTYDEILTCSDDKTAILHKRSNNNDEMSVTRTWKGHTRAVNKIIQGKNNVFTCSRDLTIKQWTKESDEAVGTFTGHTLTISAISEKTDGTLIASGSRDTTVRVWDSTTSKEITRNTTSRNLVTCMEWLPENSSILVQGSEDLKLRLWDVRTNIIKSSQTFTGYVYFPLCMSISNDGNRIMTGSKGFNGVGCEIRVWDIRMNKQYIELSGHQQDVRECHFLQREECNNSNSDIIVTASKDKTIRLWDIGKYTQEEQDNTVNSNKCVLNEYHMYGDGTFTCMDVFNDSSKSKSSSVSVMYCIADMDGVPSTYVTDLSQ